LRTSRWWADGSSASGGAVVEERRDTARLRSGDVRNLYVGAVARHLPGRSLVLPGPSNAALVFFGATCGTPNTVEKSLNISLDFPATGVAGDAPALPKKSRGGLASGRGVRAVRCPRAKRSKRRVGEGEGKLELGDRQPEHIRSNRPALPRRRERLARQSCCGSWGGFSRRSTARRMALLSPRKTNPATSLRSWADERLGGEEVRQVRQAGPWAAGRRSRRGCRGSPEPDEKAHRST